MKKYFFFSALTALALTGCTSDEILNPEVGPDTPPPVSDETPIVFSSRATATTRADKTGADAATLLGNNFVVEGVKGDGSFGSYAVTNVVFDHYNVNYTASTANTTESNTDDWEYVGQDQVIKGLAAKLSSASAQSIKYWDYSQNQYDYVAVSLGNGKAVAATYTAATGTYDSSAGITYYSDDQGTIADMSSFTDGASVSSLFVEATPASDTYAELSTIDYTKIGGAIKSDGTDAVYTLTGTADELAASYVADLITLYNHDAVSDYNTVVTPKFRRLGAKVRLAFYETVPGYSVGDVEFYAQKWVDAKPGSTTNGSSSTTPTIFAENAVFTPATGDGVMSVYYPTVGFAKRPGGASADTDYNQAHVVFKAATTGGVTMATSKTFGALNYTNPTTSATNTGNALGITSATATYAGNLSADNAYYTVLPLGSSDNLQIRIKYTLYPDDGGSETIVVDNARAVVPAKYAAWNPNYAYTYIFKIGDNTNGATGVDGAGNIIEGLTPITFDAVVIDTEDGIQETITTVATPSITTYQEGRVVTLGSEYVAGDIYVTAVDGTTEKNSPITLYQVSQAVTGATISEATCELAYNMGKSDPSSDLYDKTNIYLTQLYGGTTVAEVPAVDGNTLAVPAFKFTATSGLTYVVRYDGGAGKVAYKVIKVQ